MGAKHKSEEVKGRVKEAAGALTDNERRRTEGQNDQASAAVKRNATKAKDKVKDAAKSTKDKLTK
jgi:uncharacterized protein YjbJ (UPF0337 family)